MDAAAKKLGVSVEEPEKKKTYKKEDFLLFKLEPHATKASGCVHARARVCACALFCHRLEVLLDPRHMQTMYAGCI